jgi:hypothetical protein
MRQLQSVAPRHCVQHVTLLLAVGIAVRSYYRVSKWNYAFAPPGIQALILSNMRPIMGTRK